MLFKLGWDVAVCKIHHMVHILMLLWQHARFQSPASSKLNITICDSKRQNIFDLEEEGTGTEHVTLATSKREPSGIS